MNNKKIEWVAAVVATAIIWIATSFAVCCAIKATGNVWVFLVYILLPTPSYKSKKDDDK